MKNRDFYLKIFSFFFFFLDEIFYYVYLNRRVFVMFLTARWPVDPQTK